MTASRTYQLRTYGCQMNVHDSERLAGLLEEAGYRRAADDAVPDVVVFNTCAVRENADNRLYGNLGQLLPVKTSSPGMQIAVGGCLAQKDRGEILRRAPWVDVVFGTHNIGSLPALLDRARVQDEAQVEIAESLERFPSTLPTRRESAYAAWVAISVGCNNTCTFCIVPSLRGREKDRRPGDVLAEIRALVDDGVLEVTLLGQNVNSYGVEFGDRQAFAKLLRACGEIDGLERVRFTSPHPRDFTDDVIAAMAQTPNVMPQLHMPLQSGSNAVLRAMRRAYRRDSYLAILDQVRAAIPDAAITTDIIVGFPGETERDFADTLDMVRQARFAGAFTFQYSIRRPGTPAATMDGQVPPRSSPSATAGWSRWSRRSPWPRTRRWSAAGRGAGRRRGGPQGRRDPPDVRPGQGQPPGALRARRARSRGRATWSRPCDPGRAAPPDRGRRAARSAAPGAATPGRRAGDAGQGRRTRARREPGTAPGPGPARHARAAAGRSASG